MKTIENSSAIDPEVLADLEAVCDFGGIVRDPLLFRRVTERADEARAETERLFGVQELGVEIIREMRESG